MDIWTWTHLTRNALSSKQAKKKPPTAAHFSVCNLHNTAAGQSAAFNEDKRVKSLCRAAIMKDSAVVVLKWKPAPITIPRA